MARPRSPNRDKAYQLWLDSGKKRQLKDIAVELQVSEEQVRKWKNQDKWDKVTLPNAKSNVTNHKGAPPGNKNAVGNKGGAAPKGNKNAVTTGEFETLLFDCLDEEEKRLVQAVPADKQQLLLQEIQLLTVRERRMLKRIESLKQAEAESGTAGKYEISVPPGMTVTGYKAGIEKGKITDLGEYKGVLGQIQSIEDALTRVQARKQKAIDSLHRFGFDDASLEIELMKVELAALKLGSQEEEQGDDGFLDALNGKAANLWGDEDGN